MYTVPERPMDILLCESTRLIDKLSHSSMVSRPDIEQFGNALLNVQTEIHRQKKVESKGLFESV